MEKISKDEIIRAIQDGVYEAFQMMVNIDRHEFGERLFLAVRDGVKDAFSNTNRELVHDAISNGVGSAMENLEMTELIKSGVEDAFGFEVSYNEIDIQEVIHNAIREAVSDD